jgi:hypothetical protein
MFAEICRTYNNGKPPEETLDYLQLGNITHTPLAICGCPRVSVCPPDEDCPDLKGQSFVGHRVFFSATVEGSCCEDICTTSDGQEYKDCVKACKEEDGC